MGFVTPPAPQTAPSSARKVRKTEFFGAGALVQLLGVVVMFVLFPLGIIPGVVLLVGGSVMSRRWACGRCFGKIDKRASMCPHCGAQLYDQR